ncbi:MAG: hypothetical protein QF898_04660 [SAR202 cluster bacterium]|nr:hypothetical protein [SAR202 cluster bacterium]
MANYYEVFLSLNISIVEEVAESEEEAIQKIKHDIDENGVSDRICMEANALPYEDGERHIGDGSIHGDS